MGNRPSDYVPGWVSEPCLWCRDLLAWPRRYFCSPGCIDAWQAANDRRPGRTRTPD